MSRCKALPYAFVTVASVTLLLSNCAPKKLQPPEVSVNNDGRSPAELIIAADPGATAYYSLDGGKEIVPYSPQTPQYFIDDVDVTVVQKKPGFADSDLTTTHFQIKHVLAGPETLTKPKDGPTGSWVTRGNGFIVAFDSINGNGVGTKDNTLVKVVLQIRGIPEGQWSGTVQPGNIALTDAVVAVGSVTLTFGDGKTTTFSQGFNGPGIYDFNISVANKSIELIIPEVFLPEWDVESHNESVNLPSPYLDLSPAYHVNK